MALDSRFQFVRRHAIAARLFTPPSRICWIVSAAASSTEKAPRNQMALCSSFMPSIHLRSLRSIVSAFLVKPSFHVKKVRLSQVKASCIRIPFCVLPMITSSFLVVAAYRSQMLRYDPRYFFRIFFCISYIKILPGIRVVIIINYRNLSCISSLTLQCSAMAEFPPLE